MAFCSLTMSTRYGLEVTDTAEKTHTINRILIPCSFFFVLKANALRETGVLTGNSTCTTLGDPSKGIYIHVFFILHPVLPSLSLSLISYDIYVLKLNVKILF